MTTPPLPKDFANDRHARDHLCDHVLSHREAFDWSILIPEYREIVDPNDDDKLQLLALSMYSGSPSQESLSLLAGYRREIRTAMDDSVRLGWWWQSNDLTWTGLGLSGTCVIWTAHWILTAYSMQKVNSPVAANNRTIEPRPRNQRATRKIPHPVDLTVARYEVYHRNCEIFVNRAYAKAYEDIGVRSVGNHKFFGTMQRPMRRQAWTTLVAERHCKQELGYDTAG